MKDFITFALVFAIALIGIVGSAVNFINQPIASICCLLIACVVVMLLVHNYINGLRYDAEVN